MRPQPRPFMVETNSRRRATQRENSASSTRREDWLVPPDDLPERDVKEDLGVAPAHEAGHLQKPPGALLGIMIRWTWSRTGAWDAGSGRVLRYRGASEGAFGQGRHARAAEWFGGV